MLTVIIGTLACGTGVALMISVTAVPRVLSRSIMSRFDERQSLKQPSKSSTRHPEDVRFADFLEHWGRACSTGASISAGFLESLQALPEFQRPLAIVAHRVHRGMSVSEARDEAIPDRWGRIFDLVGRTGHWKSLSREARLIRAAAAERQESTSQLATLRASLRVLTWSPLAFAGFVIGLSQSARSFMFGSVGGVLCLVIGVALNALGRAWLRRLLVESRKDEEIEFVDEIVAALDTGMGVTEALSYVRSRRGNNKDGESRSFNAREVIVDLRRSSPSIAPAIDLIEAGVEDGLPLTSGLTEFAENWRTREADASRAHIRAMSVKANIPLVACVLPSLIFLAFAPLGVAILAPLTSPAP